MHGSTEGAGGVSSNSRWGAATSGGGNGGKLGVCCVCSQTLDQALEGVREMDSFHWGVPSPVEDGWIPSNAWHHHPTVEGQWMANRINKQGSWPWPLDTSSQQLPLLPQGNRWHMYNRYNLQMQINMYCIQKYDMYMILHANTWPEAFCTTRSRSKEPRDTLDRRVGASSGGGGAFICATWSGNMLKLRNTAPHPAKFNKIPWVVFFLWGRGGF